MPIDRPDPEVRQESPAAVASLAGGAARHVHNIAAAVLAAGGLILLWELYLVDASIHNGTLLANSVSAQAAAIGIVVTVAGGIVGVWWFLRERFGPDAQDAGTTPQGVSHEPDDQPMGTPAESEVSE